MSSNGCWPAGTIKDCFSGASSFFQSSPSTTVCIQPYRKRRPAQPRFTKDQYRVKVPLSCPDLTAVAVEYVAQRVPAPPSLVWRHAHGNLGSSAGQFSVHSRAREKCKFVRQKSN